MTIKSNEREFREQLSKKVSGTAVGIWLLVPGLLKLGAWDIIKAWSNTTDLDIEPRIAMQLVNEAALCTNRIRKKNSLGHQGFELLNGLATLVSDEQAHYFLNNHTYEEAYNMMLNLGIQRQLCGHFQDDVIALDPHRILSTSERTMAKKKKKSDAPSQKMLQTFFAVSAATGQPIMSTMASTGMPTTRATLKLLEAMGQIVKGKSLLLADKEHFSKEMYNKVKTHPNFDLLAPALNTSRVKKTIRDLIYNRVTAGVALSKTGFFFDGDNNEHRLIAQRLGENQNQYTYNTFLTTSDFDAVKLLSEEYDKRWSVEEFFRFENHMGLNRTSTHNLNIRYAKMGLAMIAQGATYELRKNLREDYKKWEAGHLASEILAWNDGDIRVKDDTIIVTFYGHSKYLKKDEYINLPHKLAKDGINPRIPWLYDFKLDFRFK